MFSESRMLQLSRENIKCELIYPQQPLTITFTSKRHHSHTLTVQMKNWLPLVLGPAFAILTTPGPICDTAIHFMLQNHMCKDNCRYMVKLIVLCIFFFPFIFSVWRKITLIIIYWLKEDRRYKDRPDVHIKTV